MNNKIITIKNVRAYQDENGIVQLNLEDISRGLGFTQSKNEVKYIRWERIIGYLKEFGFPTCGENGKVPEYVPENIFYKLCFKAENKIAIEFQNVVTDEILPTLRKHGAYMTPDKIEEVLSNPDTIIQLATTLKKEREEKQRLQLENTQQKQIIGELKPKADYLDTILQNKGLVTITAIAKDYGMSGEEMNKKLHELGIQYNQSKQWFLYSKYHSQGYTHSETIDLTHRDGTKFVKMNTKWTQKRKTVLI